jgi:hypothetical protein
MQQQSIHRDLAGMPPGPELAALLARIDVSAVPDDRVHEVLGAAARQLAHQQAYLWSTMAEIGGRTPQLDLPDGRQWTPNQIFDSAAAEIQAELRLTRRSAEDELTRAARVTALPQVAQALSAGVLDRSRALVLADGCWDLTDAQTSELLAGVLPKAGTQTTSQLADKVRRIAVALDPAWAERRYREAVQQRRVVGRPGDRGVCPGGRVGGGGKARGCCGQCGSSAGRVVSRAARRPIP